jgi:glutamate dehydrogenase
LASAPDIVTIAGASGKPVEAVAAAHFGLDDLLAIDNLVSTAAGMPLADGYDRLARDRALTIIGAAHRGITAKVVALHGPEDRPGAALEAWLTRETSVGKAQERLKALAETSPSVAKLTVAAGLLDDLAR